MTDISLISIGGFLVGFGVFLFVKALRHCLKERIFPLGWENWGIVIGISIIMIGAGIGLLITGIRGY